MSENSFYRHSLYKTVMLFVFVGFSLVTSAKEGMWLPPTLKQREADLKALGLQIPVDRIYNEQGTGLNNAVVLFGKGCTGEIISSKGLLLTNHHCGYGTVQGLSTVEKDYFANGFWAMNNKEEIPCPGLTVTFIRKMENVTHLIVPGIPDTLREAARDSIIAGKIKGLEKGYAYTTKMDASIKPFFNGNQYWVIISETFRDVRLVGFPPNGIGQFGGDTDNWMWPRHTGDFSMFRVYADKKNKPADYSKDNVPYQTKNFFTINVSGYKEGDFTMVYGFPAATQEYISSYQLNQVYSISDPIKIALRTTKLDVWTKHMSASRDVFLKYTSKRASLANGWKKWQGELRGLRLNDVPAKKRAQEAEFQSWAMSGNAQPYDRDLLSNLNANANRADSVLKAETYVQEAVFGVELIQQAATLDKMLQTIRSHLPENLMQDSLAKLAKSLDAFYKNYDWSTDRDVFNVLIPEYLKAAGSWTPASYRKTYREYRKNAESWAADVFNISMLARQDRLMAFAGQAKLKDTTRILSDPAWQLFNAISKYRRQYIVPALTQYATKMSYYNRLYMKGQMAEKWNTLFYPDANFTLRLTYGKVEGMDPDGPADYSFQTNLDQAIEKDDPEVEEFRVPAKLKQLHQEKNYGRWGVNGTVPLAFIAGNHTSGGNSGSPVLNAKGQLIGTNFDRVWEGTMSDLYFDPRLCRNISLDIRYTLFIVEKFGGAGWLLKEMNLVKK